VAGTGAARVAPVPLELGWKLRTVSGTVDELGAYAADDAFLRVFVREPARPGLADEVRALLPNAVDVRVVVEEPVAGEIAVPARTSLSPHDLFAAYLDVAGQARDDRVLAMFDELLDEVSA